MAIELLTAYCYQTECPMNAQLLPAHGASQDAAPAQVMDTRTWSAFRDSLLGKPAPAQPVPGFLPPPALAALYADAIVRYWERCERCGTLDPQAPLYVLDAAGGRQRARRLFRALMARLAHTPAWRERCRYVIFSPHASELAAIEQHPYFALQVQAGRMDFALCDSVHGMGALHLRHSGECLRTLANPPAILMHEHFNQLHRELYSLHYGKVFSVRLEMAPTSRQPSAKISYAWHEESLAALPAPEADLLQQYLAAVNVAQIMLPSGALAACQHIARLCAGRYLLLAHGAGALHWRQIRSEIEPLPPQWPERVATPRRINYHALALGLRRAGAQVWQTAPDKDTVLTLVLGPNEAAAPLDELATIMTPAESADLMPLATASATANWNVAQALRLLRQSHYDPRVFLQLYPRLDKALPAEHGAQGDAWRSALSAVWNHCYAPDERPALLRAIVTLAMQTRHWGLAREVLEQLERWHASNAEDLYLQACCEAQTGNLTQAIALLGLACAAHPVQQRHQQAHAAMLRRHAARRTRHGALLDGLAAQDITLETLGPEHAAAFLHQFRDPHIGVMAGLPPMQTEAAVLSWMEEKIREAGKALYAVMHQDWGFVGMVALEYLDASAVFYFWTGSDFQGRGYGGRAARLLCQHAASLGVDFIFTTVYPDNSRSRAALVRSNFSLMPVQAMAPHHELLFYCRSSAALREAEQLSRIAVFSQRAGIGFRFETCSSIEADLIGTI